MSKIKEFFTLSNFNYGQISIFFSAISVSEFKDNSIVTGMIFIILSFLIIIFKPIRYEIPKKSHGEILKIIEEIQKEIKRRRMERANDKNKM